MKRIVIKTIVIEIMFFSTMILAQSKLDCKPILSTKNNAVTIGDAIYIEKKYDISIQKVIDVSKGVPEQIRATKYYQINKSNVFESKEPNTVTLVNGFGSILPQYNSNQLTLQSKNGEHFLKHISGIGYKHFIGKDLLAQIYDDTLEINGFSKAIEYMGKSNNTMKFIYKEFIQDANGNYIIRDAFSTPFEVEISSDSVVVFKGAVIKINAITPYGLEVEPIRGFN